MDRYLRKLTGNGNWFWVLVYGTIFVYLIARLVMLPEVTPNTSQCLPKDAASWLSFKQAVTLPLAILLGAIFVHMFSNPIASPSTEGLDEHDKTAVLARALQAQSLQRRNWMIFAYGFMLVALVVPIYLFGPGWDTDRAVSLDRRNDLNHPVSIFVGCSLGQQGELSCSTKNMDADNGEQASAGKPSSSVPPTDTKKAEKSEAISGGAWVLNLGGHVTNASTCAPCNIAQCKDGKVLTDNTAPCKDASGAGAVCQVQGGLLVPIYVIILALIGGGISLTRRLPEYQKRAHPEFISTDKESRLSQHEFREYLVFQMVQFVSAPLLAILAYFLVDPSNSASSVVLAFSAGFASESILLMVRALTEKFTPADDTPASGTLTGTVSHVEDGISRPVAKAEVSLASSSQLRTVTDSAGFYVLGNVPIGEHGIKVTADGFQPASDSVKIEQAQQIVTKHWKLDDKKP